MTNTQAKDMNRNPTGKGGFKDRPQDRGRGFWKREETARYKLELIIKMSDTEIQDLIEDPSTPVFDKRMAEAVQDGKWRELDGMINQIYGRPKESIDVTSNGETIGATIVFEDKPTE